MSVQEAVKLAGSIKALADLLGITRPAIYQWKTGIPQMRMYQLKVLKPEWF
jgi:DNA-binding transcriptional regulator YdaS (Cro superfamily)